MTSAENDIIIQTDEDGLRINRVFSERGIATRKAADTMIEKKTVIVNGSVAVIGQRVKAGDYITLKKSTNAKNSASTYVAYYKPAGVETVSAQKGEHAIKDVFPKTKVGSKLFPVGRLDKDSEGLIILTDDGRITKRLLSPEFAHEKEYMVTLSEKYDPEFLGRMSRGIRIGGAKSDRARSALHSGYTTKPCTVRAMSAKTFTITLTEGKNRQIRRMCQALGHDVAHLKRIRIMDITLGNLRSGQHRELSGKELSGFLKSLHIQH